MVKFKEGGTYRSLGSDNSFLVVERLGDMKPYGDIHKGRPKRGGGEGFEKIGQNWTLEKGEGRVLRNRTFNPLLAFFSEIVIRKWKI